MPGKICVGVWILSWVVLGHFSRAEPPLEVGERRELFLDRALTLEETGDLERVMLRPQAREVVLTCDAPWEGNTSGYFTVFQDEDRYRIYYRGWQHDPVTKKQVRDAVTCYAESTDGIHFEKPDLGRIEWEGSRKNNIIWTGQAAHNVTVFKDGNPGAPKGVAYRALGSVGRMWKPGRGLVALQSSDGLSWELSREEPVLTRGAFDSQNLAFWDADRGEYRAYWRIFTDGVRAIRTATSRDFLTWENESDLTYPEGTPNEHLYTNAVQPYFRAPHLLIGFPTRYLPDEGQRVEPVLMASRDGVRFERWSEPVIPEEAPEDRAGNRSNYMAWGMVQLPGKPEEISVYASERYYGEHPGRLRRFVYRTDGFVALRGGKQGGAWLSRPLQVAPGRLSLNYVVREGGALVVEVLTPETDEVIGKAELGPGDAIDQAVAWQLEPDLHGPVQLRFHLRSADLYSFQFANPGEELVRSVSKVTLRRNRDGKGTTWFHPRACMVPDKAGDPVALMNLQEIGGSDYFGPVHWSESRDGGTTWSEPQLIPALGRDPVAGHEGLLAGVCDVTPQYHPQTGTVLALGHVVFYRGARFSKGDQLARYPVYVVRREDGTWSDRKILQWDDPRGAHIYSNNCGQRLVEPNGDILMSFTFGPESKNRMVAGVRCTFDGEELRIAEVGPPLQNAVGRGLLEPSLARFGDQVFLTMRAEDGRGYVAVSRDGLNYGEKRAWAWDDGEPLEMSTTQQHWLTHSKGLFLVYTRKDESNSGVIRWRSPLWMARVDPERLCLLRKTERVVLPLVGDGVKDPDGVALMGNFQVTNFSEQESWVTVGEWLPRREARGDLLLARIRWLRPNREAGKVLLRGEN